MKKNIGFARKFFRAKNVNYKKKKKKKNIYIFFFFLSSFFLLFFILFFLNCLIIFVTYISLEICQPDMGNLFFFAQDFSIHFLQPFRRNGAQTTTNDKIFPSKKVLPFRRNGRLPPPFRRNGYI